MCKNITDANEFVGINEIKIPMQNWEQPIDQIIKNADLILIHSEYKFSKGFLWECSQIKQFIAARKIILILLIYKDKKRTTAISGLFGIDIEKLTIKGKKVEVFFTFGKNWTSKQHLSLESAVAALVR